jgi:adenylate cyclase
MNLRPERKAWPTLGARSSAVNLASRLEGIAEPGQIVLSHTAAEHLGDEIELEDLGERALKNVDQPVRCWAIRG